jgi:hypothetical protein
MGIYTPVRSHHGEKYSEINSIQSKLAKTIHKHLIDQDKLSNFYLNNQLDARGFDPTDDSGCR